MATLPTTSLSSTTAGHHDPGRGIGQPSPGTRRGQDRRGSSIGGSPPQQSHRTGVCTTQRHTTWRQATTAGWIAVVTASGPLLGAIASWALTVLIALGADGPDTP